MAAVATNYVSVIRSWSVKDLAEMDSLLEAGWEIKGFQWQTGGYAFLLVRPMVKHM